MLTSHRPRFRYLATLLLPALLLSIPTPAETPAAPPVEAARPKLAVLIYFDQLRGDYLVRWDGLFGEGGFHRLDKDGAWFQNCHYPFAATITGPGHASVATGCSPERHGIITNDWYVRAAGTSVYCVGSDRYEIIPPKAKQTDPEKEDKETKTGESVKYRGVSPDRLLSPTLADALKKATEGKGRVVSLSFKDRSAALPGGKRPDACYWLDTATGTFVTSTYYRDRLHPWVEEYNAAHPADQWVEKQWERLRPDLDYVKHSGPDDVKGEGKGVFQGTTFPHPMSGNPDKAKRKASYYGALYNSPFGNDLLLGLVKKAIDGERLGADDVPDLLCVSFSSNDPVGHCWGPDSQEVLDVTLRSDLIVKELLDYLDAKVGKGNYVVALTADHGVCPLPEVAKAQGKEAGRVPALLLAAQAAAFLNETFGAKEKGDSPRWIEGIGSSWLYLNQDVIRRRGLKSADVEAALVGWLKQQTGIQTAYGRAELLAGVPKDDVIGQKVLRSFHPDRAGDVTVVLKPYYLATTTYLTGTNHGMPHPYDTHVPLLVYGPGVRPGVRKEAVVPQAAAVILAKALGIAAPADADAAVPEGLFERGRE